MKFLHYLVLLLPVLGVACTTLDNGPYRFNEGWRSGAVEDVSTAGAMARHKPDDCRDDVAARYPASTPFALVGYKSSRMTRHRAIPLPEGLAVKVGDTVFVNVNRCSDGLASEVK